MEKVKLIWRIELREICRILKDNGVDIQKIPITKKATDGKRIPTTLKDIDQDGIDIIKIVQENELDINFPIGHYIKKYREIYNGTVGNLTKEEREDGEILGIVVKRNENVSAPIFKGRKLSQFHLNFINGILDKILNGQINTREALELLRQASIDSGEAIIDDVGSIKRCVGILLKNRPEELEAYHKMIKKNSGRRNPNKGNIGKPKIGLYHEKEAELKRHIIEKYLPLIISGQITFDMIEQETHCSHKTINKIIEEHYRKNNDLEGLEIYKTAKKNNNGLKKRAEKRRKTAEELREKIANYNVVTKNVFLFLPPEEQEMQIVMKYQVGKLSEERKRKSKNKERQYLSFLVNEDAIRNYMSNTIEYFMSKNKANKKYFSVDDIRYMIFRYPSILGRTKETLDEKMEVLTSYDEIDEETAYGMIKTFPAIMGYEASRTKKQLDLLAKEGLIDAVISMPSIFMNSVNFMYALIQYAKERHHTSNLENIKLRNIFLSDGTLKRLYGISKEEIKAKYPYIEENETDIEYTIAPDEIGKLTYSARGKSEEADKVLNQAIRNNKKERKN